MVSNLHIQIALDLANLLWDDDYTDDVAVARWLLDCALEARRGNQDRWLARIIPA